METFQDESKCNQLLTKSENDLKTEEDKRKAQREALTEEGYNGLKIREVMLERLQKQTRIFVKEYLGEPDRIIYSGDGDVLVYTRPISIYEPGAEPDEEIYIFFKRNLVRTVNVVKPASVRAQGFSWGKWLKGSKKNQNEQKGSDQLEEK
ncbi:hypothetical protein [Leptospira kanakyensis]|uniref:Uncharacterized protein n=1 Tax=Leptospira kanakyensis TaxID=2484968 RepID=A0A6N4PZV5_9LEPT|nr:hypothetical protein [Leptospira kanakyensis]MCW7468522.1 hypothetical protein [Leptospira kanakyensis]MCW7479514.1 hypothetical protein [Leptospira kanakyensis]TGK51582.1 hypothetical protein EHQ11_08290 [Leptospira kanakyensis]TGK58717.1 hypothetical protein EHQ16_14165 [Leptospira kanakyensis]TGK70920.1 hypothetical protein EHQ18_09035 [Leptospira kanakyensis]